MSDPVERTVRDAIKQAVGPAKANVGLDEDIFETLGVDSVKILELLSVVEARFNIEIADYEMTDIRTLRELIELIRSRRG